MNVSEQEYRIHKWQELKTYKNRAAALDTLTRIANQVEPIMHQRHWKVGLLVEFFPKDRQLLGLNVNHGMKVCVRLRPYNDPESFLDYDSILGTLLHELVHIVRGPHDAQFYKLLDELRSECDYLIFKGIHSLAPQPFTGKGVVLAPSSTTVPRHQARDAAARAAQRRLQLTHPASTLGGDTSLYKTNLPRKMAAEAAIRRAEDNKWCGEEHADVDNQNEEDAIICTDMIQRQQNNGSSATIHHQESQKKNEIKQIQKTGHHPRIQQHEPSHGCAREHAMTRPVASSALRGDIVVIDDDDDAVAEFHGTSDSVQSYFWNKKRRLSDDGHDISGHWSCSACTFINNSDLANCEICNCSRL